VVNKKFVIFVRFLHPVFKNAKAVNLRSVTNVEKQKSGNDHMNFNFRKAIILERASMKLESVIEI